MRGRDSLEAEGVMVTAVNPPHQGWPQRLLKIWAAAGAGGAGTQLRPCLRATLREIAFAVSGSSISGNISTRGVRAILGRDPNPSRKNLLRFSPGGDVGLERGIEVDGVDDSALCTFGGFGAFKGERKERGLTLMLLPYAFWESCCLANVDTRTPSRLARTRASGLPSMRFVSRVSMRAA